MNEKNQNEEKILFAQKIRDEFINTALEAYATACGDGLCCEGAWECAIDAIRNLEPSEIINRINTSQKYF